MSTQLLVPTCIITSKNWIKNKGGPALKSSANSVGGLYVWGRVSHTSDWSAVVLVLVPLYLVGGNRYG